MENIIDKISNELLQISNQNILLRSELEKAHNQIKQLQSELDKYKISNDRHTTPPMEKL